VFRVIAGKFQLSNIFGQLLHVVGNEGALDTHLDRFPFGCAFLTASNTAVGSLETSASASSRISSPASLMMWVADFDADLRWLLEQSEQWRMAGQHTDLTLGGAGHEHFGLAGPDLLLDGDDLDVQLLGHAVSS